MLLAPQTLFAGTLGSPPDRAVRLLDSDSGGHRVCWTARTIEDGGAFLLYRGERLDQLELALSETAVRGVETYSVDDDGPASPLFFYQLRYVQQSGREVVLTTVAVTQHRLERGFPGVEFPTTYGKALVRLEWAGPVLSEVATPPIEGGLPWATAPSPEVPPPRSADVQWRGISAADTHVGT